MTPITPDTARSLSQMIQISGSAAAAAHDVRVGLIAIEPFTDLRSERLLAILLKLAHQEHVNQEAYAKNYAFIISHAMKSGV